MDFTQKIIPYATKPISYHLVRSLLHEYKRPNDKINELVKKGILTNLKKGLYMAGPNVNAKPEPFLIANYLWGPSYVSLDAALSWHGFIPERVYGISSVTLKAAKIFSTAAGNFEYIHIPAPYYSYGISQLKLADDQYAMIASAEKALCDRIISSPGVLFRSSKNVLEYLIEDLRIDESLLKSLHTGIIEEWIPAAQKKSSLLTLVKTLKDL
jgi:hypothetical protein